MVNDDSNPPLDRDALGILDDIDQRLAQAKSICKLLGAADFDRLDDGADTKSNSMWVASSMLEEAETLSMELRHTLPAPSRAEVAHD